MRRQKLSGPLVAVVRAVRSLGAALRAISGAPDYDRYRRHFASRHPGMVPLTQDDFVREQLDRRYQRPGSRCC